MRKLNLILVFFIVLFSCSSEDDNSQQVITADPFIGRWYFGDTVYKLSEGGVYLEISTSCESQSYYTFNSDGSAEIVSFFDDGSYCIMEADNISTFQWTKINSNTYELNSVENDGTVSNRTETVVFDGDNIMQWVDSFTGTTIEGDVFYERRSYFNR